MVPMKSMALLIICIPVMILAVALAVLPLILMSHTDHRRRRAETIAHSSWTPSERDTESARLAA
jgi:hypothetical protein